MEAIDGKRHGRPGVAARREQRAVWLLVAAGILGLTLLMAAAWAVGARTSPAANRAAVAPVSVPGPAAEPQPISGLMP